MSKPIGEKWLSDKEHWVYEGICESLARRELNGQDITALIARDADTERVTQEELRAAINAVQAKWLSEAKRSVRVLRAKKAKGIKTLYFGKLGRKATIDEAIQWWVDRIRNRWPGAKV